MKLLFIPFSVAGGLIAGFLAKKLFTEVWSVVEEQEPPQPNQRDVGWGKVIAASALEGAIFRGTRAAVDRGSRTVFENLTGSWPGEERPKPE